MAAVKAVLPQIYVLEYRQEKEDPDYGSCLWARFYFDTANYVMSIDSDCGSFGYKWVCTPDTESFLHLMARCSAGYILDKISSRFVIDSDVTFRNFISYLYGDADDPDEMPDEDISERIREACEYDTDREVVDYVYDAIVETFGRVDTYELYQCVEKDYPVRAKKICEIFEKHIRPAIQATLREQTT